VKRVAVISLVCIALAGCTSDDDSGEASKARITMQVSGEPEETRVFSDLAAEFEDANPNIEVRVVEVPDGDDHLARLTTSFAGGTPPDVFVVNFRDYALFASRSAMEPAGDHLEEMGIDLNDFFPEPVEAFTFNGDLQCMPQNVSSLVVYYNTDLFENAGLETPAPDWTWEDFRRTALTLTKGDVRGVGIEPQVIRIAPFVWSNGGEIVDDLESPSQFTFDDPASREALEFIVSLVRDDQVVPTESELAAQDLETRFITGKLGMVLSSRRDTPAFREVVGLNWDVAALPVANEPAGILHSDAYCVARESDEQDAAFAFVSYAMSEEGQALAALSGRTVPSRRSVAESGAFLDPVQPPEHSEVFVDGIPFIRRTPVIPTWPEIEAVSAEILTRLFYEDGYTFEDAIQDLEEQANPLFEEGTAG
jgi:multiple sugar transport system substrate-binding protein